MGADRTDGDRPRASPVIPDAVAGAVSRTLHRGRDRWNRMVSADAPSRVLRGLRARSGRQLREVNERYRASRALQQVVSAVTSAVAGASTQEEVARDALNALAEHLPLGVGSVRLIDERRQRWCRIADYGIPASERVWSPFAAQPWTPVHEVLESGRPVVVPDVRAMREQFPEVAHATAHLPLGALVSVALPHQRTDFSAVLSVTLRGSDTNVLRLAVQAVQETAPIIGQALERARLFEFQSRVAADLQHALLPRRVQYDDRLDVAARYIPAIEALEVGGDWYDVVALENDRVALIVGDAVGRGLAAATVMGQLSSAIAALVAALDDPGVALEHLDVLAQQTPGAECTTCLVAVLDPAHESLCLASAGHVPPILLSPDGTTQLLGDAQGPPLAVGHLGHRISREHAFPVGATLVLFTDGLVERRGESLDEGLQRLRDLASAAKEESRDATELGDRIVTTLVGDQRHEDDVALVTTRLVQAHSRTFTRRLGRDSSQLRPLRHDLEAWLTTWVDVPQQTRDGIVLAVSEAVANGMEHAYAEDRSGQPPLVRIDAQRLDETLRIRVRDRGSWRPAVRDTTRGRGLLLMDSLADELAVDRREDGTDVALVWNLSGAPWEEGR